MDRLSTRSIFSVIMFIIFLLIGCSPVLEYDVRADFLKDKRNAEIARCYSGEGDFRNIYYHIQYHIIGEDKKYEDIYLYQKLGESWEISSKMIDKAYLELKTERSQSCHLSTVDLSH